MRPIYKITALLLLATWLLVTNHAVLEMAGVIGDHGSGDAAVVDPSVVLDHEHDEQHPHDQNHRGWHIVEKLMAKPTTQLLLKIFAPLLSIVAIALIVAGSSLCEPTLTSVAKVAVERPIDWVTSWQFLRRAAPVSRAPSPLTA